MTKWKYNVESNCWCTWEYIYEIKPFEDMHEDMLLSQAVDWIELDMTLSQTINQYDISKEISFHLGFNEDILPDIKLPPENSLV